LYNSGPNPVFILDGDEVVGGKQNRIVNVSLLVAPRSRVKLPVSCVEERRWDSGHAFRAGENTPCSLKREKQCRVQDSLIRTQSISTNQDVLWSQIDERQQKSRRPSPTNAMN